MPDGRTVPPRPRLPLRKSLFGRLLAVSALVAACSVAATAWLAVQTTSGAIRQEQGRNLTADARIYDTLLGYAARNSTWDGVGPTVRDLARQSGRRVALTTQDRRPLADSALPASAPPLPPQASAVVDPLSVDTVLASESADRPGAAGDRVDPRAVGPFRLSAAERERLRQAADRTVECLSRAGIASDVVVEPSGRSRIQVVGNDPERAQGTRCETEALNEPTGTETKALGALNRLADACLERQGRSTVRLNQDLSWGPQATPTPVPSPVAEVAPSAEPTVMSSEGDRAIASCVGTARREQLGSYVASPRCCSSARRAGPPSPASTSPLRTPRRSPVSRLWCWPSPWAPRYSRAPGWCGLCGR